MLPVGHFPTPKEIILMEIIVNIWFSFSFGNVSDHFEVNKNLKETLRNNVQNYYFYMFIFFFPLTKLMYL